MGKIVYQHQFGLCEDYCPILKIGIKIGSVSCIKCENFVEEGKENRFSYIVCKFLTPKESPSIK